VIIARAIAVALALASSLTAARARADEGGLRLSVDWGKLAGVIRDGGDALFPSESAAWKRAQQQPDARPTSGEQQRWFGVSPHVSLVARDWGGAQLLVGHLSLTDQVRLSRSSRMVISRVRLPGGRLAPFAQIGLGQWRIDTDLMPVLPHDVELAGQLGGGFELSLAPHTVLAIEADYTILYREQHEPQHVSGPHLWGTFLAARALF
jgi:hypothetical protein